MNNINKNSSSQLLLLQSSNDLGDKDYPNNKNQVFQPQHISPVELSIELPPLSTWKIEQNDQQQQAYHRNYQQQLQTSAANYHLYNYNFNIETAAKLAAANNSSNLFTKSALSSLSSSNNISKNLYNNNAASTATSIDHQYVSSIKQFVSNDSSHHTNNIDKTNGFTNSSNNLIMPQTSQPSQSQIQPLQSPPPISSRPEKTKSIVSSYQHLLNLPPTI